MSYIKVAAMINLLQLPHNVNREEETHKVPQDKLGGDLHDRLRKTGMWTVRLGSSLNHNLLRL